MPDTTPAHRDTSVVGQRGGGVAAGAGGAAQEADQQVQLGFST
ncbi:hypothetical protein [Nonomuraea sp. NPDC003804]